MREKRPIRKSRPMMPRMMITNMRRIQRANLMSFHAMKPTSIRIKRIAQNGMTKENISIGINAPFFCSFLQPYVLFRTMDAPWSLLRISLVDEGKL